MSDRQMYIAGVISIAVAMLVIGVYIILATFANRPQPGHNRQINVGPLMITPVATASRK